MPATRRHLDRDAKREEILDAAETLMLRAGYHATSMAAIAQRAGVANNAVYWYFASKDDLLAAILDRRLERATAEVPGLATGSLEERLRALLAQLDQVAILAACVHERAGHSEAVAATHRAFHATVERMLSDGFCDAGLDPAEARCASGAVMAMIDGIHLHDGERDSDERDRVVLWAVDRMLEARTLTPSA
ncbi:MAG TPA: TetR/AcrR family transcriptional regulator [Solirubrobacteraceae bacterium]|jgi:AcrR family transcriptional regulator|nr:TetR/AcrR family transcriptional regulator [Solirubrobacteraceae bacterium]